MGADEGDRSRQRVVARRSCLSPSCHPAPSWPCVDINECAEQAEACSALVTCSNTAGGYQCGACPTGYRGDGQACTDVDECAEKLDSCDALATCTNTPGTFTCGSCPAGYAGGGATGCTDVNECTGPDRVCDPLAGCTNTVGSYACGACPTGYTGTGVTGCVDIDECAAGTDTCSAVVTCGNIAGSYQCGDCPAGYRGDGYSCSDVDECAEHTDQCSALASCVNTVGSYTCGACPSGYSGDGRTCTDMDECLTDPCDPRASCANTVGGYTCGACPAGFSGNGYAGCVDIDECDQGLDDCSPLVTCGNTLGSYRCDPCPSGYTGNGRTCTDVDECATHTSQCDARVTCTNNDGGYTCGSCPNGYAGDGRTCVDIDECATRSCDPLTACTNTAGAFLCAACPAGYAGDGYLGCVDIDECAVENGGCPATEGCLNSAGSYRCVPCAASSLGVATQCGVGACAATGLTACDHGIVVDSCTVGVAAASDADCDGVDDDCNGAVDEDFVGTSTACGVGVCASTGVTTCLGATVRDSCVAAAPSGPDSDCDGLDDDCSGSVDEDYVGASVSCGVGACAAQATNACVGGAVTNSCHPGQPMGQDASCNGVDDDCDGSVDEEFVSQATSCGVGACVATGISSCVSGQLVSSCTPAMPAVADATCDGIDDDCDGLLDEDFFAGSVECVSSGCSGVGAIVCVNGIPASSCNSNPACTAEIDCNDAVDNDGDGRTDCQDSDCASRSECFEDCANGVDDNADGAQDCADSLCSDRPPCVAEVCGNGLDDDGDQRADCTDTECRASGVCPALPLDPAALVTPLPPHPEPSVLDAFGFLLEGTDPTQQGVTAALDHETTALVSFAVRDRNNQPLSGVKVSVLDRPEIGFTYTGGRGQDELLVQGGRDVTLEFTAAGMLPVYRTVTVGWGKGVRTTDVVMIPPDPRKTEVKLDGSSASQMVRGSIETDARGTRQAMLILPSHVTGQMAFSDGSMAPLAGGSVRITEYTVGENGPETMPGELPTNIAYTYAFELSIDEATRAGATRVEFSQPLAMYVDNFLAVPVGSGIPLGNFNTNCRCWIPEEDARVVRIVSATQGLANLDVDGDGLAESEAALSALGITQEEREQLLKVHAPGKSLWRMRIPHFSPWDCNLNSAPPSDAEFPPDYAALPRPEEDDCNKAGSIISCSNQALGERLPLAGTPYALEYSSLRANKSFPSTVSVPITGPTVPASLVRVSVRSALGAEIEDYEFTREPNQTLHLEWDGLDRFSRPRDGVVDADLKVCYWYDPVVFPSRSEALRTWGAVESRLARGGALLDIARPPPGGQFSVCRTHDIRLEAPAGYVSSVLFPKPDRASAWQVDVVPQVSSLGKEIKLGLSFDDLGAESVVDRLPIYTPGWGAVGSSESTGGGLEAVLGDGTTILAERRYSDPLGGHALVAVGPGEEGTVGQLTDSNVTLCLAAYQALPDCVTRTTQEIGVIGQIDFSPEGNTAYVYSKSAFSVMRFSVERSYTAQGRPRLSLTKGIYLVGASSRVPLAFVGFLNSDETPNFLADARTVRVNQIVQVGSIFSGRQLVALDGGGVLVGASRFEGDNNPAGARYLWRVRDNGIAEALSFPQVPSYTTMDGFVAGPRGSFFARFIDARTTSSRRQTWLLWVQADGTARTVYRATATGTFQDMSQLAYDSVHDRLVVLRTNLRNTVLFQALDYRSAAARGGVSHTESLAAPVVHRISRIYDPSSPDFQQECYNGFNVERSDWGLLSDGRIRFSTWPCDESTRGQPIADLVVKPASLDVTYGGTVLAARDPLTQRVTRRYEYATNGDLVALVEADGRRTVLERDARGLLTAVVGPFGHRTQLRYDALSRVIGISNPLNEQHSFTYSGNSQLLRTMTDPEGAIATFTFDAVGRLVRDDDAAGGVQTLLRTVSATTGGSTVEHRDGDNVLTSFERSKDGIVKITTVRNANGTTATRYVEEGKGELVTLADGTSVLDDLADDPLAGAQSQFIPRREVTLPSGKKLITYSWRDVTFRTADGVPLHRTYYTGLATTKAQQLNTTAIVWRTTDDLQTGTLTSRSPEGRTSVVRYNAAGQVTQQEQPGVLPITYARDTQGRVTTITQGDRVVSVGYGADGLPATLVRPDGSTTHMTYDGAGRPTVLELPQQRSLSFRYDRDGRMLGLTPPQSAEHNWSFSPIGQPLSYSAPSTPIQRESYTPGRRRKVVTFSDGRTATANYSAAGVLTTLATPHGNYTYTYARGLVSGITTSDGSFTHARDGVLTTAMNWKPTNVTTTASLLLTYDSLFRPYRMMVGGVTYSQSAYDRDGLVTSVTAYSSTGSTLGSLSLSRSPGSTAIIGTQFGGVVTTQARNEYGEVSSFDASVNGARAYGVTNVVHDHLGRVVRAQEEVLGVVSDRQYGYDEAGRLSEVVLNGELVRRYAYDGNGNRVLAEGAVAEAGVYDAADRVTSYGLLDYTFDANGYLATSTDRASGAVRRYAYDVFGGLRSVDSIAYELDGLGRRVAKKVGGTVQKRWLYQDGLRIAAELNAANQPVSRFIYADRANVPALMVRGAVVYRLVSDLRGSVRLVIDAATGEVAQRLDYDEFGRVMTDTNPGFQPFGFAGGLYDADTGLVRFGARDYDAYTGRWTARDPILFEGGQANLYAYVGNDPINFIDPTGLDGFLSDVANGVQAYGEGFGTALAHLSARAGAFGPEGEAYAARIDAVLGAGLAAGTYAPDKIFKPGGGGVCSGVSGLAEGIWDSTGLLPDFVRAHPGYAVGRFGSGAVISAISSTPIGLSVTALAMYGSGIQAAQTGNSVIQGVLLGAY